MADSFVERMLKKNKKEVEDSLKNTDLKKESKEEETEGSKKRKKKFKKIIEGK